MKLKPIVFGMLSLIPFFSSAAEIKLPDKEKFQLFLLAGQSNMAGRGKLDAEAVKENPRILAINQKLEWQIATDPLHWDKKGAGVGIGKQFAEIIVAEYPGVSIGLIPTACGGSSINAWVPGGFHGQTKSHPWDDSIARAKLAMKDGTLKAILWHQGESDSNPKDAPNHEKQLEDLIIRFRKELNTPDLPFIIGQLGRFPARPWDENRETVNRAHQAVARKMKNVRYVGSEGSTSLDNLHFDTASARALAKGYADAYLDIIRAKP